MQQNFSSRLYPRHKFYHRLARSAAVSLAIIGGSLAVGILGYHFIEKMGWVDSFANAAMILSGMGPLNPLNTAVGKIFAGCYALFSGMAFLTSIGVVFTPIFHRFIHRFHLEEESDDSSKHRK